MSGHPLLPTMRTLVNGCLDDTLILLARCEGITNGSSSVLVIRDLRVALQDFKLKNSAMLALFRASLEASFEPEGNAIQGERKAMQEEIATLQAALLPFAKFGHALRESETGVGGLLAIRVDGEVRLTDTDFDRAGAALSPARVAASDEDAGSKG